MKTKISEATNIAKEQYLEIERQKELYDRLQVKTLRTVILWTAKTLPYIRKFKIRFCL